eukprot:scaffold136626_cov22-Cyclotella_meneghiniana.AAC.1
MGVTTSLQSATNEPSVQNNSSYNEFHQMEDNTSMTTNSDKLFNITTIAFLSLSFILAMIVDDLGIVLAIVGATGSTLVSYILPGLIYLKLHPDSSSKGMACVQLIVRLCMIPISLYYILTRQVSH